MVTGKLGDTVSVDEGYAAARLCGLGMLSSIQNRIGDLDNVIKINKVFGIVNSTPDFEEQHLVLNGASDLIMEVFEKKRGYHARSAIGTNTLPLGVSVEVECILEIKQGSAREV